jgi:hypothetical protein
MSFYKQKDGVQRSRLLQHPNYLLIEIKKCKKKERHKPKLLKKKKRKLKEKIKT